MSDERTCDGCRACCTLVAVDELDKPAQVACASLDCDACAIYESRPQECKNFNCAWLMAPPGRMSDDFRPDKVGVVCRLNDNYLSLADGTRSTVLLCHVAKHNPLAWRDGDFGKWLSMVSHTIPVVVDMPGRPGGWLMVNGETSIIEYRAEQ